MQEVTKVWGSESWVVNTGLYCLKVLFIKRLGCCSCHYHELKDETFIGVSGEVLVVMDKGVKVLRCGNTVRVRPGEYHRFIGLGDDNILLEVSTHHDDSDSYRKDASCVL